MEFDLLGLYIFTKWRPLTKKIKFYKHSWHLTNNNNMSFQILVYLVEHIMFCAHSDWWNLTLSSSIQPGSTCIRLISDLLKSSTGTRRDSNPISCSPKLLSVIPLRTNWLSRGIMLYGRDKPLLTQEDRDAGETLVFTTTAKLPFNFSCPRPNPASSSPSSYPIPRLLKIQGHLKVGV